MKKAISLSQLKADQEINIPTAFVVTLPGKKNKEMKFKAHKSYWVDEVSPSSVLVSYYSYNGRERAGVVQNRLRFDKNKNLQVNLIS